MICPVCQTELEAYFVENMAGKQERYYLQYGRRQEPVFCCSSATPHDGHGMNLWTETSIKGWVAMKKKQEKVK